MRLRLVVVAAAWSVLVLVMAPAAHASYSGDGGVTVVPPSPKVGSSITVDSSGWKANTDVTITLHSTPVVLATVKADANGAVHSTSAIPSGTSAGAHTVELTGVDPLGAPRDVSAAITVEAAGGGNLPRTGAAIAALLLVGTVLFAVGAALSSARKRAVH